MSNTEKALARVLLVLEALLGGFYVAVTRGLFVPMMAYSGYSLENMALVFLPTSISGAALSWGLYKYPEEATRRFKVLSLATHIAERFVWLTLPFFLEKPIVVAFLYMLGNAVSAVVSIFLGSLIYSYFGDVGEVMKVSVWRSAAGTAASLLGAIYMTAVSAVLPAPQSYYVSYVTAFVVGLGSSVALLLVPAYPKQIVETGGRASEEVLIRGSQAFLVLTFMLAGSNLVGLSWAPLLKDMGAPLYVSLALSITGNIGGVIGSLVIKGYKAYVAGLVANTVLTAVIPFLPLPGMHVGLSFFTSLTFMAANLLAMQIFAEINSHMGRVRASAYMTAGNYLGLLVASLVALTLARSPFLGLLLAAALKLVATVLALVAIPETAIVPERKAYEFSRMIYSISLVGYVFTVQASREFVRTFIETLALVALLLLLYTIYRFEALFIGG
ncbi:hypothetical protein [Thermofilum pendens]|uniref:MFS transporter n=1 Tax=Thermofilum pendens (strain DSM 2475 / Hrk 5) TaxID=368408 RepID=A1S193_THEPD|nr:hypothetical protein [Thermofilum pendens]ABL79223.1 hypothetical protein Tpen_1828 [Thermofilum pendens Hrk 5]